MSRIVNPSELARLSLGELHALLTRLEQNGDGFAPFLPEARRIEAALTYVRREIMRRRLPRVGY